MGDVTVGKVKTLRPGIATITVAMRGFSDDAVVTSETPGFGLLTEVGENGRVVVRIEPFWPQYEFSSRPSIAVTEILQGVADS